MVKTISQTTGYFWWQELNKIWCRAKIKLKCFHKTERFGFGQISSWQRQGSFSYSIEKQGRKKRGGGGGERKKRKSTRGREGRPQPLRLGRKGEHIQELASLRLALEQWYCSFCKWLVIKGACSWRCIQRGLNSFYTPFVCPSGYFFTTLIFSSSK